MEREQRLGINQQNGSPENDPYDYSSLYGGVWDVFPAHRKDLWELKELLIHIRNGVNEEEDLYSYLDQHPELDAMTTEFVPALGNQSALMSLRSEIEREVAHPELAKRPTRRQQPLEEAA